MRECERLNVVRLNSFFLFIIILCSAACSGRTASDQQQSQSQLVYGLTSQPAGIDPHINSEIELGIVLRQVYDTLIYRDPATQQFVPGLSSSWAISQDGLVYTFILRQDVVFHDGTPFNAQAVAANLDRIMNPANGSKKAIFLLGTYTGYEILDNYTIRLNLSQPYSPLLDSLSQIYLAMASPKALSEYSITRYQFHQVGSGPFIFVEYVPGERIILRRNPQYSWGPAFYQSPADRGADEIVFQFLQTAEQDPQNVASDLVQIMGDVTPINARELTGNSAVQVLPEPIPGQPVQFLMNTTQFPTDNLAVRQALLLATNRNQIIDAVFQRFSPVAWGPLSANTLYYSRDLIGAYSQDTAQAQNLLATAGYTDSDNNGYLDLGGQELNIHILIPPSGLLPEVTQQLADQWRAIGVKVEVDPVPTLNTMVEKVATNEYNLVAYNVFGIDPSLLNGFFLSSGAFNWSHISSPDLDNLLNAAIQQSDPVSRRDLYAQAQRMIMEQALVLPIRDYVNLNVANTSVQGLAFDAYGWFPLLGNITLNSSATS